VRILRSLVAVAAVAATTTALAVAPAMADPVNKHLKRVTPKAFDIVGVGPTPLSSCSTSCRSTTTPRTRRTTRRTRGSTAGTRHPPVIRPT
jgi:hypothetical protein